MTDHQWTITLITLFFLGVLGFIFWYDLKRFSKKAKEKVEDEK